MSEATLDPDPVAAAAAEADEVATLNDLKAHYIRAFVESDTASRRPGGNAASRRGALRDVTAAKAKLADDEPGVLHFEHSGLRPLNDQREREGR